MSSVRDIVGRVLGGKFQIVRHIGAGGMGTVYYAEQYPLQRACAVKVLEAGSLEFRERFLLEAKTVAQIRHPHVVTVYDYGQDGSLLYLAMEYVDGGTLEYAAKAGKFSVLRTARIGRQVASALAAAHTLRAVHRDLKPANIMLADGSLGDPDVRVLDFGLVKVRAATNITQPGTVMGTPRYIAPEQIRGVEVDERADIYSLGIILWELLAGRPPYKGASTQETIRMHLTGKSPPLPRGDVPPAMSLLIRRCMARNPNARPQSAQEVKMELESIMSRMEFTTSSGMRSVPPRDGDDHTLTVWAALGVTALMLALAWALSGCIRESRWEAQLAPQGGQSGHVGGLAGIGGSSGFAGNHVAVGGTGWAAGGAGVRAPVPGPGIAGPGDAQCHWPFTAHCDGDRHACEPLNTKRNCGACGVPCMIPGARVTCANRICEFLGCQRHRGDCDFQPFNGCETLLQQDPFNCGRCGISCAHLPGAVGGRCEDGECVVAACLPGLGDCNEEPQDGCETHLGSQQHCGACDRRCGGGLTNAVCQFTPTGGACQFLGCAPGAADCRGNGQCVSLSTTENCGACDRPCARGQRCQAGTCI